MVLLSVFMLDHTEGSFVHRPLCFEWSSQLLCGCCCGVASEEDENLEGSWLSTDLRLMGFPYSPGPMKQSALANMLRSHTHLFSQNLVDTQEDSRSGPSSHSHFWCNCLLGHLTAPPPIQVLQVSKNSHIKVKQLGRVAWLLRHSAGIWGQIV